MITSAPISATSARNSAIARLRDLGYIPLPVAPAQDATKYPKRNKQKKIITDSDGNPEPLFNGKNPSYLDIAGKPHTVEWTEYRTRQVGNREILQWWANPANGLGTCSGHWLDVDLKHFPDRAAMDAAVAHILDRAEWVERSQSGGYRIAIAPATLPDFSRFGIGGYPLVGEIIKNTFIVLAPTQGTHGAYTALRYGSPLAVDSVADWGIYRAKEAKPEPEPALPEVSDTTATPEPATALPEVPEPAPAPDSTAAPPLPATGLLALASKKIQSLASGNGGGDRSAALATIARELYGWENLATAESILIPDSADSVITAVAARWDCADKLGRILAPIARSACEPALAAAKGRSAAVSRLRRAYRQPDASEIVINPEDSPGSVAFETLYAAGDYVRIEDSFYRWVGTHYEIQPERAEKNRIRAVLNRCVAIGEKATTRPWRSATRVNDAYQWALMSVNFIGPDQVNPPGLNLLNGVLTFDYDDGIPEPVLAPHSPDKVYTYAPQVGYHPEADDTHAARLLDALPDKGRTAVLRVLASAIDLSAVRKACGQIVKALLFAGSGANGKDSLREAFTYIFGKAGVTSATIDDFQAYDQGRKFNLAALVSSRINWASENRASVNIDGIQSLKQFVTGDPLISEEKFAQGSEFTPRAISVFSTNDSSINLTAAMEATARRYCIVPFRKTFVTNPRGPHELKADARFKYDLEWVKAEVCPALLNTLIAEFKAIFREGIDYTPFDADMEANRLESNHLYRFALDCGLVEDDNAWVETSTLWTALRSWYEGESILKIDDQGRETWEGDVRAGDAWIKGAQQLKRRLQKIYPNIETYRTRTERGIKGLRFATRAELALKEVTSAEGYQVALTTYGATAIEKAWVYLTPEQQSAIAQWIEPETTEGRAAILLDAVEMQDFEALKYFTDLAPPHKQAIWARLSPTDRQRATEFIAQANGRTPTYSG